MRRFLEMLGLKPRGEVLRQTTLREGDLVRANYELDELWLIRENRVYRVKEPFSDIDPSNPRVALKYYGDAQKPYQGFQPLHLNPSQ